MSSYTRQQVRVHDVHIRNENFVNLDAILGKNGTGKIKDVLEKICRGKYRDKFPSPEMQAMMAWQSVGKNTYELKVSQGLEGVLTGSTVTLEIQLGNTTSVRQEANVTIRDAVQQKEVQEQTSRVRNRHVNQLLGLAATENIAQQLNAYIEQRQHNQQFNLNTNFNSVAMQNQQRSFLVEGRIN